MPLTKREIDRFSWASAGPAQQILYDDRLPGFGVRVYESGRKSFVLWYRTAGGRKRLHTLGKYGVLTLDQARTKARGMLAAVGEGKDPVEERRRKEQAVKTFRDLARRWLDEYAKGHRRSWKEDGRRLDKHVLPKLGRLGADAVGPADVRALHVKIGAGAPVEANRIANLIRAVYSWGVKVQLIPEGHPNPAGRAVTRYKERSRERWLTAPELKRLLTALDDDDDLYAVAALRLLLLTGCRKTELLRARWARLDVDGRRLLLEDTKMGEAKVTPLSAPALAVIHELPRMLHSPWIFPSPKDPEKPRADLKRAWERIRARARVKDATIHDLRRTVGSWLVQKGVPLQVIGAALGHRDQRATQIYARIAATQPAEALDMLGEAIAGLTRKEHG